MKTFKIQIPNMQSSHCQMRVNKALGTILGATNIRTQSGVASASLPMEATSAEVISTIENAGYYVTDIEQENEITFSETESTIENGIVNDHCLD